MFSENNMIYSVFIVDCDHEQSAAEGESLCGFHYLGIGWRKDMTVNTNPEWTILQEALDEEEERSDSPTVFKVLQMWYFHILGDAFSRSNKLNFQFRLSLYYID